MTDAEIRAYLREHGYPEHIEREGRPGLARRWREFVEQVERGYPLGLEDYRNDLDVRAILRRIGADDEEIQALDQRLRNLLVATNRRVWDSGVESAFWDFGYPRNAGQELVDGLREEGLLET